MASYLKSMAAILWQSFHQHGHFILYVLAYMGALLAVCAYLGTYDMISFNLYGVIPLATLLFVTAFLLGRYINMVVVTRPRPLLRYMADDFRTILRERLVMALPILIFLPVFMSAFTAFKSLIPVMNPYSWDPALYRFEAMLHGGYQPWELLQPLFGYPLITFSINFVYSAWFFTMFVVLYWQAFSLRNPKLRMQFFLSFLLAWSLLGSGLATVVSSVGPCYFERLLGEDAFKGLMQYLHSADVTYPVWALGTQDLLWNLYKNSSLTLGSGISAMPSMHVAAALLFALVGCRTHWIPGAALTVFFGFIMVGSVHLGWHYAADGYVSIVLTLGIWRLAGKWADRLPLPEGKILE